MNLEKRSIVYQPIDQPKPNPHNARTHSKHQIRQIAESICVFGFTNPILVDANDQIVAGHGWVPIGPLFLNSTTPVERNTGQQTPATPSRWTTHAFTRSFT